MTLPAALAVARLLERERIPYWFVGGFAVELVVGCEVRPHDDVDFFVAADHAARAVAVLLQRGFERIHGSLEDGDVFYEQADVVVDLVPIETTDPPRTVGTLRHVVWPAGLLTPYHAVYQGESFVTLTPEMQGQMKTVVADFYGVELRDKDRLDVRALEVLTLLRTLCGLQFDA